MTETTMNETPPPMPSAATPVMPDAGPAKLPPDTLAELRDVLMRLAETMEIGPPLLLNERAAARLAGVGYATFRRRVAAGVMPRQVAMSDGLALWRRTDIEAAVAKLKHRSMTPRIRNRDRALSLRDAAGPESQDAA